MGEKVRDTLSEEIKTYSTVLVNKAAEAAAADIIADSSDDEAGGEIRSRGRREI